MGFGKSTLYSILPPGTRYRELWLPELINNHATLPSSVAGGHGLVISGRKGTTCDGVHFDGSATSNINCGAIHNDVPTLWLSIRFKFDQAYTAGSGDQYLWGKFDDATHFLRLVFRTADGKLYFEGDDGAGGNAFSIAAQDGVADITAWEAGRSYTVLASISVANNIRFKIDNGTVVTVAWNCPAPNGGDFVIGDYDDPGAGTGFEGVEADIFCGTDDLTGAEETDLYNGIPPADAVNFWPLDEGRGLGAVAIDRGTGGNNGTLDTSCTWAYGQVEQPLLSLDGINDRASQGNNFVVDIMGATTFVWVGKMKATYNNISRNLYIWEFEIAPSMFSFRCDTGGFFRLYIVGGGAWYSVDFTATATIDDYWILMHTISATGLATMFLQGRVVGTATGVPPIAGGLARFSIGSRAGAVGSSFDISNPLFVGIIDGAFTERQARIFSKNLNSMLGLGLAI